MEKLLILMMLMLFTNNCQASSVPKNIAYGKMVSEKTFSFDFTGFLTVDGQYFNPFCYKSKFTGYQWLQIDLIWLYQIDVINIYGKLPTSKFFTFL